MGESKAIEIIEDYLNKVRENLPEGLNGEIVEELRSHIIEMINERGGLTVENAKWAISRMGDPIKLAEEIAREEGYVKKKKRFEVSIRWGDKDYRWGFELNEEIMDMFKSFLWFLIFIVLFTSLGSIAYSFAILPNNNVLDVLINSIGVLISLVVFLMIAMWLLSLFPEDKKKPIVRKVVKRKMMLSPRASYIKAGGLMIGGFFTIIISIVLGWLVLSYASLTFVTKFLALSIAVSMAYEGSILIAHSIYLALEGRKSHTLEFVGSLSSLILIPSLVLINLYPNQLQIPVLTSTRFEIESFLDIIKYIQFVNISSEYNVLAQVLSIVLIVAIVLYVVVKAATYSRERKLSSLLYF